MVRKEQVFLVFRIFFALLVKRSKSWSSEIGRKMKHFQAKPRTGQNMQDHAMITLFVGKFPTNILHMAMNKDVAAFSFAA